MPKKEIALELAEFLDSKQAASVIASAGADAVRKVAGAFISVCYDELGKRPRLLDGEDMHAALGHLLPNHFAKQDPTADQAPAILRAFIEHLKESQVVTHSFELERGFEATVDEFKETVRTGKNAHHHHHPKVDPFVHGAAKLGRNDPCSCGSGKKFKKCHGKNA